MSGKESGDGGDRTRSIFPSADFDELLDVGDFGRHGGRSNPEEVGRRVEEGFLFWLAVMLLSERG